VSPSRRPPNRSEGCIGTPGGPPDSDDVLHWVSTTRSCCTPDASTRKGTPSSSRRNVNHSTAGAGGVDGNMAFAVGVPVVGPSPDWLVAERNSVPAADEASAGFWVVHQSSCRERW
jgi:hypothetical protein